MSSGKSLQLIGTDMTYHFSVDVPLRILSIYLQLLCILPFGMLYLSAISMMFVKILLAVCMGIVV